jgi:hypothetical protein
MHCQGPVGSAAGENPLARTGSPRPPSSPRRQINPAHRRASVGEGALRVPTQFNLQPVRSIPSLLLKLRWR